MDNYCPRNAEISMTLRAKGTLGPPAVFKVNQQLLVMERFGR